MADLPIAVCTDWWVIWFRDHIHTDVDGRLAVFRTRTEARKWARKHGMPGCLVRQLK